MINKYLLKSNLSKIINNFMIELGEYGYFDNQATHHEYSQVVLTRIPLNSSILSKFNNFCEINKLDYIIYPHSISRVNSFYKNKERLKL